MGQDSPPTSTPLSRPERSLLSRQPLLTTPSQRSALLHRRRDDLLGAGTSSVLAPRLDLCHFDLLVLAAAGGNGTPSIPTTIGRNERILSPLRIGGAAALLWLALSAWHAVVRGCEHRVLQQLLWQFVSMLIVAIGINGVLVRVSACPILFFSCLRCGSHVNRCPAVLSLLL